MLVRIARTVVLAALLGSLVGFYATLGYIAVNLPAPDDWPKAKPSTPARPLGCDDPDCPCSPFRAR